MPTAYILVNCTLGSEEKIISEALVAHGTGLGIMENDRSVGFLQLVEDGIEVRIPPFFAWNRSRFYIERFAA